MNKSIIILSSALLCSCTWFYPQENQLANSGIADWSIVQYYPGVDFQTIHSPLGAEGFDFYCAEYYWSLQDSMIHADYANYHFTDSLPQHMICHTADYLKNRTFPNDTIAIENWRFWGDTAMTIKPFIRVENQTSIEKLDSATFKVLKKATFESNGQTVPWFLLANERDTVALYPMLSRIRFPSEY